MKYAAIINPHSGGGRTIEVWRETGEKLGRRLPDLKILFTEKPKQATEYAAHVARSGFERLIIVGGDGTLHECLNGLFEREKPLFLPNFSVGILNGGRGCDFTKTLGTNSNPQKMMEICLSGKVQHIDVGQVRLDEQTVYYANSSTIGLGGSIAKLVQSGSSLLPPTASYFAATVKSVIGAKPQEMIVNINDQDEPFFRGLAHNIFVCNGRYSGGGMLWAPKASLSDGLFDLLVVGNLSRPELLSLAPRIYTGTISKVKGVKSTQVSRVRVQCIQACNIELDGETYTSKTAQYKVLPSILGVLKAPTN